MLDNFAGLTAAHTYLTDGSINVERQLTRRRLILACLLKTYPEWWGNPSVVGIPYWVSQIYLLKRLLTSSKAKEPWSFYPLTSAEQAQTTKVALDLGRNAIGIELNLKYA